MSTFIGLRVWQTNFWQQLQLSIKESDTKNEKEIISFFYVGQSTIDYLPRKINQCILVDSDIPQQKLLDRHDPQ